MGRHPPALMDSRAAGPRLSRTPLVAAFLASLAFTLLVLPRTPGIGDSAEFTLALAYAGIPHPTGYPFYVLGGHAFVLLAHALGAGWVLAANLWSALGAAVAAAAYVRLTQRVLALGGGAALAPPVETAALALPVALLVLHPVWIESATIAEVYSWSHAWLAIAASVALGRLGAIDAAGAAGTLGARQSLAWGLLAGLGLAHHALALFFVAPLTLALVVAHLRSGGAPARLVPMLAVVLPSLAGAAWLSWRAAHPAPFQWPVAPALPAVLAHLTGSAYRGYLGGFAPKPGEWAAIRDTLLPVVLPGLVAGTYVTLRVPSAASRLGLLALGAGAAAVVAFVTLYGSPDPAMYLLPPLMIALLLAGPLLRALAGRVSPAIAIVLAAAVVVTLASFSLPASLRTRRRLDAVDARIRAAWALVPFDRGLVLWDDDHFHRLVVFRQLEGSRPGLDVQNPSVLSWAPARREFVRRYGVDPFGGAPVTSRDQVRAVPPYLHDRLAVPSVDFPVLIERVPRVAP